MQIILFLFQKSPLSNMLNKPANIFHDPLRPPRPLPATSTISQPKILVIATPPTPRIDAYATGILCQRIQFSILTFMRNSLVWSALISYLYDFCTSVASLLGRFTPSLNRYTFKRSSQEVIRVGCGQVRDVSAPVDT